jgi:hypothetical protein
MNSHSGNGQVLVDVLKALLIGALKLIALALAFVLKLTSVILDRLAASLQQIAGHDAAH